MILNRSGFKISSQFWRKNAEWQFFDKDKQLAVNYFLCQSFDSFLFTFSCCYDAWSTTI